MNQQAVIDTPENSNAMPTLNRVSSQDTNPTVLCDIYQDNTNIAIWQRQLNDILNQGAGVILQQNPRLKFAQVVTIDDVNQTLSDKLGETSEVKAVIDDISQLVDMFCSLFELKQAGLRLSVLTDAMCPKFHVDKVACRLVATYQGVATQWLPNHLVDRSQLGAVGQSELSYYTDDIEQLKQGDVALLKGELWQGNEGAGLVHRSPTLAPNETRLILTLDFVG